ncbi:uncharacterized protein ASPGLDRAFT_1506949 [Aspergillus glaucus CBS 516.65]|uniref:Uncharacterized protein n=1 Tax=Aspergillus glaucus CBS 516.65 TaxID=1160497 RepID=A0A1L9V5U1_ASPGL|nr:hypothetical protein ASPGLDRAFT_1506949 [Aspergillus glaucus CBS 516.65]OJJ79276.1 hypothetical protein ASPGLDRAFT_1506949 [Aspergillus glaucus CBS 516.65]
MPARKKIKEESLSNRLVDDHILNELQDTYLSTLVLSVYDVLTIWGKGMNNMNQNHTLDTNLVQQLEAALKVGARWMANEHALKASISTEKFYYILRKHIISQCRIAGADDLQNNGDDLKDGNIEDQVQALQEKSWTKDEIISIPDLPNDLDDVPIIWNGQHRMHALWGLLDRQSSLAGGTAGGGNSGEPEEESGDGIPMPKHQDALWLIDLYAEERLTDTLMAALAANHDTIHWVNSEGYNAYQIIYQFLLLPTDTQMKLHKSSEFNSWLFNIWLPEFDHFFTFGKTVFSQHINTISYDDWQLLLEAEQKCSVFNLHLLFFPQVEDYWEDDGTPCKTPWALPPQFQKHVSLPKLNIETEDLDPSCTTCRPGLLEHLEPADYVQVWCNLSENDSLSCPHWRDICKMEQRVSAKVKFVLQHILSWTSLKWKYPAQASKEYCTFDWVNEVEHVLFTANNVDPQTRPFSDADNRHSLAKEFILGVWEEVKAENMWQEKGIDGQAGPCLISGMAVFNDTEKLEDSLAPYSLWGLIISTSNFKENLVLQKVPSLNTADIRASLIEEGEIFGTLWHYCQLKRVMIDTCKHGWGKNQKNGKDVVICSAEEYDTAIEVLEGCALVLAQYGFKLEPDNHHEDLAQYTLNHLEEQHEPAPPLPGFLQQRPPEYVSYDDMVHSQWTEMRRLVVKNMLYKPVSKKQKRNTQYQLPSSLCHKGSTKLTEKEKRLHH